MQTMGDDELLFFGDEWWKVDGWIKPKEQPDNTIVFF